MLTLLYQTVRGKTMDKYYLTTAIDYVNGAPHIGHAYEKILTDIILNCADTVCVIFNDKIGDYKQNFVYMTSIADGKFKKTNIKIKDLLMSPKLDKGGL